MKLFWFLALVGLTAASGLSGCAVSPAAGDGAVQRLVSEDDHVRIDELRVRGQTQRLSVQNKDSAAPGYDILTPGAGRDPSREHRDATGQRVWTVLSF